MRQLRTLEEAEEILNATGRPPEDEYIVLADGQTLRTREEVLAWVQRMIETAGDDSA